VKNIQTNLLKEISMREESIKKFINDIYEREFDDRKLQQHRQQNQILKNEKEIENLKTTISSKIDEKNT